MKYFQLPLQKEASLGNEQDDKDSHSLQIRVACMGVTTQDRDAVKKCRKITSITRSQQLSSLTKKSLKSNNRKGDFSP